MDSQNLLFQARNRSVNTDGQDGQTGHPLVATDNHVVTQQYSEDARADVCVETNRLALCAFYHHNNQLRARTG